MAELAGSWFEGISTTLRKKRKVRHRRTEFTAAKENSPSPVASPFDERTKPSCDDNGRPAIRSVSHQRASNHVDPEAKIPRNKLVQDGRNYALFENETNQIGMIAHKNHQNIPGYRTSGDAQPTNGHFGRENEKKLKRVKLKVDGVTHTIQANATPKDKLNGFCATDDPSLKDLRSDQKNIAKDGHTYPLNKSSGLQETPWEDFPRSDFSAGGKDCPMGRPGKVKPSKVERSEPVRKSKRAPNRRVLDLTPEDDEVDDEIRFLEKLRNSRSSIGYNEDEDEDDEVPSRKHQKYSRVFEISLVTGNCSEVSENLENEDQDATQKSKERDTVADLKRNTMLTARQRALQSGRGGPSSPDANLEFPNGLQAVPSKKKKDTLSEKELIMKAEAAQKRRLQNEKAAQKSQEDAIRKILNQDSSKKKKEDQRKKRLEELAEEKAAEALKHQSDTVRVVMAPMGTIVSFGENCIPSIFTAKPSSYPPPRESCAGPSCTNPYKYRDSKSKLPLCSLKCYKAVRERLDKESSCQDYISNSSS